MKKDKTATKLSERAAALADALNEIPIDLITKTTVELLGAKKITIGRDGTPIQEPDNYTRLRVLELLVEQTMGTPGQRRPIEPGLEGPGTGAAVIPGALKPAAKVRMIEHEDVSENASQMVAAAAARVAPVKATVNAYNETSGEKQSQQ